MRHTRHNTGEQQDRNTVADTVLVDLLAHPHHQRRTGGEGEDDNHSREGLLPTTVEHGDGGSLIRAVVQIEVVSGTLNQAQHNGDVTGNGGNLLAALFALFGQALQRRQGHSQQLQNNGAVDVGCNAHGKQGSVCERTAGEHI